ncbi:MlaD family protein [bacterium]|jgi:phospholipid/cholesterol/gamma-HCH transport system substrate-binding protein|nr:MlaD family protein [bacterium]
MNPNEATKMIKFKVGVFTVVSLAVISLVSVLVNDHPYWWRRCDLVYINIDDATGLKTKSPVNSLGIQVGYLQSIELAETHVRLGICITAPVEVLPTTRAYIRGQGFLGDKFVEVKPVRYLGKPVDTSKLLNLIIPTAEAAPAAPATIEEKPVRRAGSGGKDIPVGQSNENIQDLVKQVDSLVGEMRGLTSNLKDAINPKELRQTMSQLNKTLDSAARTLSPESNLNTTAQRTLAKLEDAIEQFRDLMTRVNKGEGSVGKLLNDPVYAEDIRELIRNANRVLSRVGGTRFIVDAGAMYVTGYENTRAHFQLGIWPDPDRYYLVGLGYDPRGRVTELNTVTTVGGQSVTTNTVQTELNAIVFTAMLGKVFVDRIDLSAGIFNNDGTASLQFLAGPDGSERMFAIRGDGYSRKSLNGIQARATFTTRPLINSKLFSSVYLTGGIDSLQRVNGNLPFFFGAGLSFDDQDIKILFALR